MNTSRKEEISRNVAQVTIGEEQAQQRIDNFLMRALKGVPKSHVYRLLRTGQVRVNSARVSADYRLKTGDVVRLPPVRVAAPAAVPDADEAATELPVCYEDEALLVIDKPAGVAVHGGSGVSSGVIERLRVQRPAAPFLELVHRLDKDTSGLLMLAKKRSALTEMHRQLRDGEIDKHYLALVAGKWRNATQRVRAPLRRYLTGDGERRVAVDDGGMSADTLFTRERIWPGFALLDAKLGTGRTHQIRVHLAHIGFPVAGDTKYGGAEANRSLRARGLRRLFLHAARLGFTHPLKGGKIQLESPLPEELRLFLDQLNEGVAT